MFTLTIETDNADFADYNSANYAAARILRHLADQMEDAPADTLFNLRDINGNRVGQAEFTND